MYRNLISHLFHEANDKIFYFETSPASQCHYTQRLVNKSRYLHSDPICAIESCPETCLPSNSCFTRASPLLFLLLGYIIIRTASHATKYIHQRDSPLVRLLGGEGTIPKSTQYVTVVTDITQ